eukprot:11209590-Lingulodinium_polyedra.AAC.1
MPRRLSTPFQRVSWRRPTGEGSCTRRSQFGGSVGSARGLLTASCALSAAGSFRAVGSGAPPQ